MPARILGAEMRKAVAQERKGERHEPGLQRHLQLPVPRSACWTTGSGQWLDLYSESVEYWMPAWDDDDRLTEDHSQISLIYYPNRNGLEDRVFRSKTERSNYPHPSRTNHAVQNVEVLEDQGRRSGRTLQLPRSATATRPQTVLRHHVRDCNAMATASALPARRSF